MYDIERTTRLAVFGWDLWLLWFTACTVYTDPRTPLR